VIVNRLKVRAGHVAKVREAGRFTFAVRERPSKLLLEELDGARQRGLRHIAPLAGASEIQLLGQREEVTNLMHLHDDVSVLPRPPEIHVR
jgi:hypothetical protein